MTKKIGRPPESVPQDVAEEIVEWISHGKTLRDFCRLEGKPAWRTVYAWMEKDKEFYARIAHARELGHDAIAEECLEIIDTKPEMATSSGKDSYSEHRDSAHVGWLKNRAEMRLKLLAKWNPKKYGDKTMTEVTGADGGAIQIDDTERAAKLQSILAAATARKNGSSV
jgi:hypothetical protein